MTQPSTRLSTRALTRTLWVRQQLVPSRRSVTGVIPVVEHLIGLQAQDNLPPYLSLTARIDDFAPGDLSDRLLDRTLVRFFSMRGTVHVLTPEDALQLRPWVQPTLDRLTNEESRAGAHLSSEELDAVVRPFLGDDAKPHADIVRALAEVHPDVPEVALRHATRQRLPLLQTPPRGMWKRSGGVVYALADRWLGRPFTEVHLPDLVQRYLRAYGPATAADMTKWSSVTRLGPAFTALHRAGELVSYTDEHGRTLYDVPDGVIADEDLALAPLMLGTYDNLFLSHADRTRIAPDEARRGWMGRNGAMAATLFVDGLLCGIWRFDGDHFEVEPFRRLTSSEERGVEAEKDRVRAFLAS